MSIPKYTKLLTRSAKNPTVEEFIRCPLYFLHGTGKTLYVTEGIADAITLNHITGKPCIATTTTTVSNGSLDELIAISKFYKKIVVANDNDNNMSGQNGAISTLEKLLSNNVKSCYIVEIPRSNDKDKIDLNEYFTTAGQTKDDFSKLKEYSLFEYQVFTMSPDEITDHIESICKNAIAQTSSINQAKIKLRQALKGKGFSASDISDMLKELVSHKHATIKKHNPHAPAVELDTDDLPAIEDIRKEVKTILYKPDGNVAMTQDIIYSTIMPHLSAVGRFLSDGNYIYYLDKRKRLRPVSDRDESMQVVLGEYGIVKARKAIYDYILQTAAVNTEVNAMENNKVATVYKFSHYDMEENTLYIDNADGRMIAITENDIQFTDNGHNNIIFKSEPGAIPFIDSPDIPPPPEKLMDKFSNFIVNGLNLQDSILTADQMRILAIHYIFAMFFDTLNPTKILAIAIGEMGSGKTSFFKHIMYMFYGKETNILRVGESSKKDIDNIASNNHFSVIDNLDEYIDWMDNFLASAATGGEIQVRKLYTDNTVIKLKLSTWIGITSRIPRSFTRPDIADRSLYLRFGRLTGQKLGDEYLLSRFLKNRLDINTDVIYFLQEILASIAKFLHDHPRPEDYETEYHPLPTPIRMVDFSNFCLMASYTRPELYDATLSALTALAQEQQSFMVQNSNIYNTIMDYLIHVDFMSDGWTVEKSSVELHKEMLDLSYKKELDYNYKSAKGLSFALTELKELDSFIQVIERKRGNVKYYRFKIVKPEGENDNETVELTDDIPF